VSKKHDFSASAKFSAERSAEGKGKHAVQCAILKFPLKCPGNKVENQGISVSLDFPFLLVAT